MEENKIPQPCRQQAIDYKRNISNKFILVEGAKLKSRVEGEDFAVTRKIDGHLQIVFLRDGEVFMLNSQGRQKASALPCLDRMGSQLKRAGEASATIAAELYMPREGGRPRCGDVARALADTSQRQLLSLAPFDIIDIDGTPWQAGHYKETWSRLAAMFTDPLTRPVDMKTASTIDEVQAIYDEWVTGEGAEGLVIHSESSYIWKLKPRHTIDTAVIGYTTGDQGVRDLMMAARRDDGSFQMFALGSNGLDDGERQSLAQRLAQRHVESEYVLSDSRGIAYQMVIPGPVFELSVIELVARGNDDRIKMNPLLDYDKERGWLFLGTVPGVSTFGMVFQRERTDKEPTAADIRISQLTDLCPFEEPEAAGATAKSQMLERRVFKKEQKGKVMLHKFLLWKTNKEATGRFPAYIVYHTDYSSSRKDPIKRDMLYSDSHEQILQLMEQEIADNVKKGWEEVK